MKRLFLGLTGVVLAGMAAVSVGAVAHDGEPKPRHISGVVTSISTECNYDGTCSVTLDSTKTIITGCGLGAGGKTCKSYDVSNLQIGQQVNATVVQDKHGLYDLECPACTIRPVIY